MRAKLANGIIINKWKPKTFQKPTTTSLATSLCPEYNTESHPSLLPIATSTRPYQVCPSKLCNTMKQFSGKKNNKWASSTMNHNPIKGVLKSKILENNSPTEWIKLVDSRVSLKRIKEESIYLKDKCLTSKLKFKKPNTSTKIRFLTLRPPAIMTNRLIRKELAILKNNSKKPKIST